MGCAQSRIENEEAVARCKERRQFMKAAVAARNAFAAAHSAYAFSLRDTGAALSEFAHGEGVPPPPPPPPSSAEPKAAARLSAAAAAAPAPAPIDEEMPPPPPIDTMLPPPPPLPEFSPSPGKIHRSMSMPMPPKAEARGPAAMLHSDSIREEDELEDDDEDATDDDDARLDDRRRRLRHRHQPPPTSSPPPPETPITPQPPPPPPPPPPTLDPKSGSVDTWDYFFSMEEGMAASLATEDDEIVPDPEDATYIPASPPPPPASPPPPPPAPIPSPSYDDEEEPRTPEMATPPPTLPPKHPKKKKGKGKAKPKNKEVHHQHTESAPVVTGWGKAGHGKVAPAEAAPRVDLLRVLKEIDDSFLRASESAKEVSTLLEANRMHYHSNFADNAKGHIDHSARVMQIITWNRSFSGLQNGDDGKDDFENDPSETLATVVDKILAWEKKLYDEVKAGEIMKLEYQRKVALLNRQKKNNAGIDVLEKTKAAVTHLHTRYIVDMQSMDSTVSEIQHLRDNQLYQKLLDLADRMAKMWEDMHIHHANQLKTVLDLKAADISDSNIETSAHHHSHTRQLRDIVEKWTANFSDLMSHQKEYINALYSWLKLNLIPIESSLKEKVASPPRMQQPPVKALLQSWNEQLAKLPDDLARHAIISFRAVLDTILSVQDEELKQKENCNQLHKEYVRKARAFEDWYHKHAQRRTFDDPESGEGTSQKDAISEKRFAVESLKSKLDDEVEVHNKLSKQVREKSLSILKAHLPELFRALTDFSSASFGMHSQLRLMSLMQDQGSHN
ncbi:protein ALTERED PHOSPHATE STARVATION RESPONSE 1-like [Lolium rigidum]|uniref:protein ALTERED PHOSPHATE STARVATION RESPONSE 1-like n=1 Tax=Lolium rigidum TaxID=89674 RepID=UPI001F5D5D0C|nr:protein ALTERED PHOSPHATE STARVATION RESPONSE 1-like [Lolium rigidum]